MDIYEHATNKMIENVKLSVLAKFPLLGATLSNLIIEESDNSDLTTAGTDGEKVLYNKEFIENIPFEERVFTLTHEIMHIAFNHIYRCKDKDMDVWNIATDAVINQKISKQMQIPDWCVNMPEATDKSAEEMYNILYQEKEEEKEIFNKRHGGKSGESKNGNGSSDDENSQEGEGNKNDEDKENKNGSHGNWKDIANKKNQEGLDEEDFEKSFNESNASMKKNIAKDVIDRIKSKQNSSKSSNDYSLHSSQSKRRIVSNIGESRPLINWKKILKKEIEKEDDRWSYRRADEDNDFQARIESVEVENKKNIELLLDTSGSIDSKLIKKFLRQVKPMAKDNILKVGCFDTKFYGFQRVDKVEDVDALKLEGGGGTDFNMAVDSFSQEKNTSKLIFTDGYGKMNKNNKKYKDIMWFVFKNSNFEPAVGKTVWVDKDEVMTNDEK